jgi:hypothetical protein
MTMMNDTEQTLTHMTGHVHLDHTSILRGEIEYDMALDIYKRFPAASTTSRLGRESVRTAARNTEHEPLTTA